MDWAPELSGSCRIPSSEDDAHSAAKAAATENAIAGRESDGRNAAVATPKLPTPNRNKSYTLSYLSLSGVHPFGLND